MKKIYECVLKLSGMKTKNDLVIILILVVVTGGRNVRATLMEFSWIHPITYTTLDTDNDDGSDDNNTNGDDKPDKPVLRNHNRSQNLIAKVRPLCVFTGNCTRGHKTTTFLNYNSRNVSKVHEYHDSRPHTTPGLPGHPLPILSGPPWGMPSGPMGSGQQTWLTWYLVLLLFWKGHFVGGGLSLSILTGLKTANSCINSSGWAVNKRLGALLEY